MYSLLSTIYDSYEKLAGYWRLVTATDRRTVSVLMMIIVQCELEVAILGLGLRLLLRIKR